VVVLVPPVEEVDPDPDAEEPLPVVVVEGVVEPVVGEVVVELPPLDAAELPPVFGACGARVQFRSLVILLYTPRMRFSISVASRLDWVCVSVTLNSVYTAANTSVARNEASKTSIRVKAERRWRL
jgi:hypothetical protein